MINVSTITITYSTAVNVFANANVNLVAVMGPDATSKLIDYQSFVTTVLRKGFWNGLTFIPAAQITLVTAS